jgi:hypothetical protein
MRLTRNEGDGRNKKAENKDSLAAASHGVSSQGEITSACLASLQLIPSFAFQGIE